PALSETARPLKRKGALQPRKRAQNEGLTILRNLRATRIFRSAALPSRSRLEAGRLREDSRAVRQFLRAAAQAGRIQDWSADSLVRAFPASDPVRVDKAVRAP